MIKRPGAQTNGIFKPQKLLDEALNSYVISLAHGIGKNIEPLFVGKLHDWTHTRQHN